MKYLSVKNTLTLLFFLLIILGYLFSRDLAAWSFEYVQSNISPNSHMKSGTDGLVVIIRSYLTLLLGFGLCILILLYTKVGGRLVCIFFPENVRIFFMGDPKSDPIFRKFNRFVVIFSLLFGIPATIMVFFNYTPPVQFLLQEDGIFEYASFLKLILSSVILVAVFIIGRRKKIAEYKFANYFFVILSILTAFVAFEEISWGQRIFDIETSPVLKEINHQNELNLHNIFNLYFPFIYPVSSVFIFAVCMLGWIPEREKRTERFQLVFPHSSLSILTFFSLISCIGGEKEVFETFISFMLLFYSINLYLMYVYDEDIRILNVNKINQVS